MTIELPIKLKYFIVDQGFSVLMREGDLPVHVYRIVNQETGMVEAEGQNLAETYNTALSMDINLEHATVYYIKDNGQLGHLDIATEEAVEEEDPLAGLLLPGEQKIERLN